MATAAVSLHCVFCLVYAVGFFFSSYPQTTEFLTVIMREGSYTRLLTDIYSIGNLFACLLTSLVVIGVGDTTHHDYAPKSRLLIKLSPGISREKREDVINDLKYVTTSRCRMQKRSSGTG